MAWWLVPRLWSLESWLPIWVTLRKLPPWETVSMNRKRRNLA